MSNSGKAKTMVPTFLAKLLKILQDTECHDYITWLQTFDGFQILNVQQFTSNVLPKYFKHQNFSSFVRQLNMYGFNKLRGKQNQNIYQNPLFKKGNKVSFKKIQRKIPNLPQESEIQKYQDQVTDPLQKSLKNLSEIKEKQSQLQQKFRNVFQKNNRIFTQNKQIILEMGECTKNDETFIFDLIQKIKSSSKGNPLIQIQEVQSLLDSKSADTFDVKYKQQSSTLEGSVNSFRRISQYLDLSQFEQLQQFDN